MILHCMCFCFIETMAFDSSADSAAISQSLPSEGIITFVGWVINVQICLYCLICSYGCFALHWSICDFN